jgi:hypothetical protein
VAYNTLHALHALVRAREAGDATLESAIERGLAIAPQLIRNEIEDPQASRALRAYLLYIESLRGENEVAAVTALWREKSKHAPSVETVGWLLSALGKNASQSPVAKELLGSLDNRASETASMATFTESYSDAEHVILHSDERSNAIALEGVLHAAPDHDLAPKLAKGLLAHQKQGRWGNTQENVFAALALRAYFDHYEKDVPSFDARVFLGAVLALDGSYHGRTTQQASTTVPMRYLAEHPRESLVVQKIGTGRMYYRLGLSYAPKSLALAPTAQGFEVERSYEGVDDPSDVTRDASGTWYVKAGARVRANVTMVAKARRFNVALVDPLAAGFEPMQASLHGMQQDPGSGGAPCPVCKMWWGPWWEHQNERDERSEAFTSTLDGGVYTYSHMLRATTPGEFIVAPAKAEEMYTPETFGRSGSDRVVVR